MSVSAANGAHALAVLVVEDDFFVRYDIAGCLREAGYAVVETGTAAEACRPSALVGQNGLIA